MLPLNQYSYYSACEKDSSISVPETKWFTFILGFGLTADGVKHHLYQLRTKHPDGKERKTRTQLLLQENLGV